MTKVLRLVVGALSTNCWICHWDDGKSAVIDPGGDASRIINFLKNEQLRPEFILLTHGHFDHIAALPELHEAFPEAETAVHRADYEYVGKAGFERACADFLNAVNDDSYIRSAWRDMPPVSLLEDGGHIGPFSVLHTPGHTKGSVSFFEEKEKNLFSGDTLFQNGIGRTDLYGGNLAELKTSLKRLAALDGETKVFPGHGGATSIQQELKV